MTRILEIQVFFLQPCVPFFNIVFFSFFGEIRVLYNNFFIMPRLIQKRYSTKWKLLVIFSYNEVNFFENWIFSLILSLVAHFHVFLFLQFFFGNASFNNQRIRTFFYDFLFIFFIVFDQAFSTATVLFSFCCTWIVIFTNNQRLCLFDFFFFFCVLMLKMLFLYFLLMSRSRSQKTKFLCYQMWFVTSYANEFIMAFVFFNFISNTKLLF